MDWYFLASIFISKSIVFFLAIFLTIVTLRPINFGLAAVFAIFVSQSNDFALGVPIVNAVYAESHPNYVHYIYLIAPISLCILNPIAFFLLEYNEQSAKLDGIKVKLNQDEPNESDTEQVEEELDYANNIDENNLLTNRARSSVQSEQIDPTTSSIERSGSFIFQSVAALKVVQKPMKQSRFDLIKLTMWATASNPIVFMTFIGVVVNFLFKQKLPGLIEPIITTMANSFSAIALFYLGFCLVGKIRNLTFSMIIIILILIITKGLIYPLITREIIVLLKETKDSSPIERNETSALSTFGFLYGTFPTAPSLLVSKHSHWFTDIENYTFFFITRFILLVIKRLSMIWSVLPWCLALWQALP